MLYFCLFPFWKREILIKNRPAAVGLQGSDIDYSLCMVVNKATCRLRYLP